MSIKKVLVTGGAGLIGSCVVKELLSRGKKVYVLDDFSHAGFKNLLGIDCEVICADVADASVIKKIPPVDAVIHEAAVTDTTLDDDARMMSVNFKGFTHILSYCLKKKIRLVYASSAGVYGNGPSPMRENQPPRPLNIYGYSKWLCDKHVQHLARREDTPVIVGLRYFNVYGPGEYHKGSSASMTYQLYLQMNRGRRPRVFKYGEQKRDFIYVKDVARATVNALSLKRSALINVGTGVPRSFNDIINVINRVLKKNLKPVYFDNPYKEMYQDHTAADTTLLKKTLLRKGCCTLEDGIADYIKNYLHIS